MGNNAIASIGDLSDLQNMYENHEPLGSNRAKPAASWKKKGREPQKWEKPKCQEVQHSQQAAPANTAPLTPEQFTAESIPLRGLDIHMPGPKGKTIQQTAQFGCVIHRDHTAERLEITILTSCLPHHGVREFKLNPPCQHRFDYKGVLEVTWTRAGVYFLLMSAAEAAAHAIPKGYIKGMMSEEEVAEFDRARRFEPKWTNIMPVIRWGSDSALNDLSEFTGMKVAAGSPVAYYVYRAVSPAAWRIMEPYVTGALKDLVRVDFKAAYRAIYLLEHEAGRSGCIINIDPIVGVTSIVVDAPVVTACDYEPKMRIIRETDYMSSSTPAQAGNRGNTVPYKKQWEGAAA